MSNFGFLFIDNCFKPFADEAIYAESVFSSDIKECVIHCYKSMELAIKWLYSVDESLNEPYQEALSTLIGDYDFQVLVGDDILKRIEYLNRCYALTSSANRSRALNADVATLCLENLFVLLDFIYCCYSDGDKQNTFDTSVLSSVSTVSATPNAQTISLNEMVVANRSSRESYTSMRSIKFATYSPKPLAISEFKTRKIYIDTMLVDAGWIQNKNWIDEYELQGMPNKSGVGYADYVLFSDSGLPLAVVEAKKTCKDPSVGRQQGKLYCDLLEKKFGRRPVLFITNGFDTRYNDNQYPERKVSVIPSPADLERWFVLKSHRESLANVDVNQDIAGRYYQIGAIKSVCESFENNRRSALLVMATGSGKTRTIIGLIDVLLKKGWIKNVLFLADRTALVRQAKRSFVLQLSSLSVSNICEEKDNYSAHCIFSTYQTMMGCIDEAKVDGNKVFTSGHFDLVICDEAHRSIYNKYKEIFDYFDAPLVGLTATPKDEIDKNTYKIFNLEKGVPTYGYELAQAVKDNYLVDYTSIKTKLNFIENGIRYSDLSDEDKEKYEETFANEDGSIPEEIDSSALNDWLFNEDTIKKVLSTLMLNGLKIDYGTKIGKTIIFAKNHNHAEKIFEVFNKEYPQFPGYAQVIDNQINYSQTLIDEFSDPKKLPQIAISVDMLDTGIDVPEVLNLVMFKTVKSKAKFWQMIGRGTRLCEGLIDGVNKTQFYVFDFCGNFDFFEMNDGEEAKIQPTVQGSIFFMKAQLALKLQDIQYQTEEYIDFRNQLVSDMVKKVKELNRDNFAVKQHLKYVDNYSQVDSYSLLSLNDVYDLRDELAHLIIADEDDPRAIRFDATMLALESAIIMGKSKDRFFKDLQKKAEGLFKVMNTIPEVKAHSEIITRLMTDINCLKNAGITDVETIRIQLRDLMKYIIVEPRKTVDIDFDDDILKVDWDKSNLTGDDRLINYKKKVEFYIRSHIEDDVISKLYTNIPLNSEDIDKLENLLWNKLGSKEDYETEYGQKPLGELVRELVGLDINSAKEAFAEFISTHSLDSRQIYFINQIIEYIVQNGMLTDMKVLTSSPFSDQGSVVEIFTDLSIWQGVVSVINSINNNMNIA